jgi:hypothetical protein
MSMSWEEFTDADGSAYEAFKAFRDNRNKQLEEERRRQEAIKQAQEAEEARRSQLYSKFEVKDVGQKEFLGIKGGKIQELNITGNTSINNRDDFIKQFDSLSDDTKNAYMKKIGSRITDIENNAKKIYETAKKEGKSEDEAKKLAANTINDDYFAATNTLKAIQDTGRDKGSFMDFIKGSNDKFFGGLTRGAIRAGAFVTGNNDKANDWIKQAGQEEQKQQTQWGKAGEFAGEAQKFALDLASMAIPAGAATKAVSGLDKIEKLTSSGSKAAQFAGKLLPQAAGSATATAIGAGQDIANGKEEDLVKNAIIGTAVDTALPVIGKAAKAADKLAGKGIAKVGSELGREEIADSVIKELGENGAFNTLNKFVSNKMKGLGYATEDALNKTEVGSKLVDLKDKFFQKMVSDNHYLYKSLRRAEYESGKSGLELTAREKIGDINRAGAAAQSWLGENEDSVALASMLQAKAFAGDEVKLSKNISKDLSSTHSYAEVAKSFDEYAKVRSELDLAKAGKKKFSKEKLAELNERMARFKDNDFSQEYDHLVNIYRADLDNRLEHGLISKEDYDNLTKEGLDYVRQQRELPDWRIEKGTGGKGGSKASLSKSDTIQKRDKYASQELLSPLETMMQRVTDTHIEIARNDAARNIANMLEDAGLAKSIKTTDMVNEKKALLGELKEGKDISNQLKKTLQTYKTQARDLTREISWIKGEGRKELTGNIREVGKHLDELAAQNPNGLISEQQMIDTLASLETKDFKVLRRKLENRNSKLEPLLDRIEVLRGNLDEVASKNSSLWKQANAIKTSPDKSNIPVMEYLDNGVNNVVKIDDPDIARAIHQWGQEKNNILIDIGRSTNNIFKYGTTGANAAFAIPNFIADQVSSAVNSKAFFRTFNPVNFTRSVFMAMDKPLTAADKEILDQYIKHNSGSLSINQYTKKDNTKRAALNFVKDGNKETDTLGESVTKLFKNPEKAMTDIKRKGVKAYTYITNPKEGLRALRDATEEAIGVTENITRIQNMRGAYKKALANGDTASDALRVGKQAARENSTDFMEGGEWGKVINAFVPYFNSSVQGSRTLMRNMRDNPVSTSLKIATLVGAPLASSTAWNLSDEKRAGIYKTIPEYVKDNNFVVITPGATWNEKTRKWDGVLLFKKPPGVKDFAEPVRKFMEYKASKPDSNIGDFLKDKGGDIAVDVAKSMQPLDFSSPERLLGSITPQILKPTAEAILNRNFFTGKDIVPEKMLKEDPADQKYKHYSQLTGHIATMFNTSPLKVDHWIRQTFGEAGTNAQHYIDRTMGAPEEARGGRSLPESISRRFLGAPGGEDESAFYDIYSKAYRAKEKASSRVTELIKAGRMNEAKRRAEEYNETVDGRFSGFFEQYGNSPTFNDEWVAKKDKLKIPITDRSFKARAKRK